VETARFLFCVWWRSRVCDP